MCSEGVGRMSGAFAVTSRDRGGRFPITTPTDLRRAGVTTVTCQINCRESNVRTMRHRRSLLTPVGRAPALVYFAVVDALLSATAFSRAAESMYADTL